MFYIKWKIKNDFSCLNHNNSVKFVTYLVYFNPHRDREWTLKEGGTQVRVNQRLVIMQVLVIENSKRKIEKKIMKIFGGTTNFWV